jgi:hypothetical protein
MPPEPAEIQPAAMPVKRGRKPKVVLSQDQTIAELVRQLAPILKTDERALAAAIVTGLREGQRNPEKEAQLARARARGKAMAAETARERASREKRCHHMRSFPYQGLSKIAWAIQSDGIKRGYCPDCDSMFEPGHPRYEELVRIQTSPLLEGNVV